MKAQMFVLLAIAALAAVPAAQAHDDDHHGHYDVTCSTRNARGNVWNAEGTAEHSRDGHVWRELQEDANMDCRASGSLVCIALGCREVFHHDHD